MKLLVTILSILWFPLLYAQCNFDAPSSRDAAWSSDGSQIVFTSNESGNSEIYLMNPDGSGKKQITDTKYPNYYPYFSPDDSQIVFMSYRDPITVIMIMNSDGSDIRRLTSDAVNNADPSWSPDGSKIIFYSSRDGNDEIYMMNPDGNNQARLTYNNSVEQTPSISPDGERILFVSDRDGNPEIYTMKISGEDVKRVTTDPRSDRVPRWSPDSRHIVYYAREHPKVAGSVSHSWSGAEIYRVDVDGNEREQLTHNHHLDQGPEVSHDTKKILFTTCRTGVREVFVMDADGQNPQQLTQSM